MLIACSPRRCQCTDTPFTVCSPSAVHLDAPCIEGCVQTKPTCTVIKSSNQKRIAGCAAIPFAASQQTVAQNQQYTEVSLHHECASMHMHNTRTSSLSKFGWRRVNTFLLTSFMFDQIVLRRVHFWCSCLTRRHQLPELAQVVLPVRQDMLCPRGVSVLHMCFKKLPQLRLASAGLYSLHRNNL